MDELSQSLHKRQTTAAVIDLLAELWPAAFSVYQGRRRPLAIGIHEPLLDALAGAIEPHELRRALGVYCSNEGYLRALARRGAVRIGLDGELTSFVTDDDSDAARALLKQARRKPAAEKGGRA
jgi:sRNA-binding protein